MTAVCCCLRAAVAGVCHQQAYDAEATPSYGTDTLEGFFDKALKEGLKGQELGDQAVFGVGE